MTATTTPRPPPANADLDPRAPAERLGRLLDPGSIVVMNSGLDSGVRTVAARIGATDVVAYCTDARMLGGALGAEGALCIVEAIDVAIRKACPVVGIWHSGGARLAEGIGSMDGVGLMFAAMTRASGRIPQVSVVVGPAAGAAAYGPALTDVVIMAPAARMFVTGPDVVRSVTGEQTDMEGLGGPEVHGRHSGVAHLSTESEDDAYFAARRVTDLLWRPGDLDTGKVPVGDDLRALLPPATNRAYDVRPLVHALTDDGFDELQPKWAPNIVVGLGRLGGRAIGLIANNPLRKGGCLDSLSAEKAARFVRMCDAFGVPLVVLVDVPGYLPGVEQEFAGVIRRGAKLLHAFAEAVVPRITLVTRKSYGGAYIAMNSRSLGASEVFAWASAEIDVMGAESAVGILHRKRLASTSDAAAREALRAELAEEHTRISGGVSHALALGAVDEVIDPRQTRHRIALALRRAPKRRGRHSNIPL